VAGNEGAGRKIEDRAAVHLLIEGKSKFVEPLQRFYVRHWSIWRLPREVKMLAPALRDEPAMKLTDLPQAH